MKVKSDANTDDFLDVPPPPSENPPKDTKTHSADSEKHKKTTNFVTQSLGTKLLPHGHHAKHSKDSKDKHVNTNNITHPESFANTEVCFAVRTAFMHDSAEEIKSKTMFEDVDIDGFILCKFLFGFNTRDWVIRFTRRPCPHHNVFTFHHSVLTSLFLSHCFSFLQRCCGRRTPCGWLISSSPT